MKPRAKHPAQPFLVGVPEACDMLGIGRSKLYQLLDAGDLNAARLGRRRLITVASISALAERLAAVPQIPK